jgi:hypothetical protein
MQEVGSSAQESGFWALSLWLLANPDVPALMRTIFGVQPLIKARTPGVNLLHPFWGASMKETLSPIFAKYDMTMVTMLAQGHS